MGNNKEVEAYKCYLCQFITRHKHNVKRHFGRQHRADHFDETKIATIKLDPAEDNNKKTKEDKTISKVPLKNTVTKTSQRRNIRIVFMCHTCFDEFSSRHERDVHHCVPSEDIHIEELDDPESNPLYATGQSNLYQIWCYQSLLVIYYLQTTGLKAFISIILHQK